MKKILYRCLALAISAVFLFSCKTDDIMVYDSESYLQFGPKSSLIYDTYYTFADTTKYYTFYYDNPSVTKNDVFFDLYVIGAPKNYDRSFKLRQVNVEEGINAVPGVNYVAFDSEEMQSEYVIPKGMCHVLVPIRLIRTADTDLYHLRFTLVETNDFEIGEERLAWRRIEFTSDLQKPDRWNQLNDFFGNYSKVKHAFMIETTGHLWNNEFFASFNDIVMVQTLQTRLVNEINRVNAEREAEGLGKLKDENGVIIKFSKD